MPALFIIMLKKLYLESYKQFKEFPFNRLLAITFLVFLVGLLEFFSPKGEWLNYSIQINTGLITGVVFLYILSKQF